MRSSIKLGLAVVGVTEGGVPVAGYVSLITEGENARVTISPSFHHPIAVPADLVVEAPGVSDLRPKIRIIEQTAEQTQPAAAAALDDVAGQGIAPASAQGTAPAAAVGESPVATS